MLWLCLKGVLDAHESLVQLWDNPLPQPVSLQELESNNSEIGFDDVREWIETYDGIEGRLRFFQVYMALSPLWLKVGRPLMSMRTTGSMDVERAAKPIKNQILTRERNRLSDEKGIVLFRAQQNLKNLMDTRMALKGKVVDSLLKHAAGICNGAAVLHLQQRDGERRGGDGELV